MRGTHTFLFDEKIDMIANYVPDAFKGIEHVIIAKEDDVTYGFMGIQEHHL